MNNVSSIVRPVTGLLKMILSKHLIIVILLCLFALLYAVYSVNQLIAGTADDAAYRAKRQAEAVRTHFDQDTINRLDQLRARQEQTSLVLPPGRVNPFVE